MDDEQPLVITSKHTVANTVTAPDDYLSLLQPSESATAVLDTNTYLSTIDLTKTLTEGSEQKVISTKDVVTQVVITESVPPKSTSVMTSYIALDVEDIAPTATKDYSSTDVIKTYFVTYTYYNTFLENGKTVVKVNVSTSSDVVTEKIYLKKTLSKQQSTSSDNVIVTTPIDHKPSKTKATKTNISSTSTVDVPINIYATKTYQTTYTYFTTYLQDSNQNNFKSPVVSSNTRTVENVVTEKIENSLLDSDLVHDLGQKLDKHSLNSVIATAVLKSGEKLEITAVPKNEIKPTKTADLNSKSSLALPLIHNNQKVESTAPNVITGSTILFDFDQNDPFQNLITPSLSIKPTKIKKSTIKNELGNLLSSEIVQKDQSVAEAQQNYVTSILGSKTIISNGATLQPGDEVIVINNDKKNTSTIIPVTDPNKKKNNKNANKNSANKNQAAKPATTSNVSNLFGSLNMNSLQALGPVFNVMAGLIQTNLQHRRNDNTTLTSPKVTTTTTTTTTTMTTPKIKLADAQSRNPIYIPVGGFVDDILESAESQNVPSFDLNLPPQIFPENKWINEELKHKNNVLIGKPTHESPLVNGGIPISPGQVITANSDVIVGKPAILGPRIPNINKNKGPHHEDEIPLGMKPPPLPKRNWPKHHNENNNKGQLEGSNKTPPPNNLNQFSGSLSYVPAIPIQQYQEEQQYKTHYDTVPQFTNINVASPGNNKHVFENNYNSQQNAQNIQLHDNNHPNNNYNRQNIQATRVQNSNQSPTIIFAQPAQENNLKVPVGDPISLPEIIERSTGQHLLVNIQPSQVANVIIPHGSTTALIFGGASEPHKNGQYFDDPSPYPEPETNPSFVGINNYQNSVPNYGSVYNKFQATPNQKPVSGTINVDSQSIHQGIGANVPSLSFGTSKPGQGPMKPLNTGVINVDSHINNHDINVHVPPISFGMVNHGDDFTAHIINHDTKIQPPSVSYNIIDKDHDEILNEPPLFIGTNNHNINPPHRPTSFNNQYNKYQPTFSNGQDITYAHIGNGDININVSPQPLPNLKQEHVVPNGIVLDGSLDKTHLHFYGQNKPHYHGRPGFEQNHASTRPDLKQQKPLFIENLTPPSIPKYSNTRPRPNYSQKINPLEFMAPPPLTKSPESRPDYPKPITIPLNYAVTSQNSITTPIQPNYNKASVFKPDDYSGEDFDVDNSGSEENEDGEVIQESKTRPLRPGQVPYEVLKINATSTTTFKPTSITHANSNKNTSNRVPQTAGPFKKIPTNAYHYNPDSPRPFRKNQNDRYNTSYPSKIKTDLLFPPVIKEGIHRHNPYIPFGTVLPQNPNRPQIFTPKPHVFRITTPSPHPHFSTSMPISEVINNKRPYVPNILGNINIQTYNRPTSMPVDSKEDSVSTHKPIIQHQVNIQQSGLQTEEPFRSPQIRQQFDKNTTQQKFSFSNKDVMTTEPNTNIPSKAHITTEKTSNFNYGDVLKKVTTQTTIFNNKEKVDNIDSIVSIDTNDYKNIYQKKNTTTTDLEVQKLEKLMPPKINTTHSTNIGIPDVEMKPPKPNKIRKNSLESHTQSTSHPYLLTPSAEMKPPPAIEYTTPHKVEQVMGLSPPPLSSSSDRVSTHKPILSYPVEISTYRPTFTFPKVTKDSPPYTFETPTPTTKENVEVNTRKSTSTKRPTTLISTRIYSRYTTTTPKSFVLTNRPIFRWTNPKISTPSITTVSKEAVTTERGYKISEIISVSQPNSTTIRPTTLKKSKPSTMEIIIGHPTIHASSTTTTTEKHSSLIVQNRNDKNNFEIKKLDTTKLKPSAPVRNTNSKNVPETIYNNLYTKSSEIHPTTTLKETFSTGIHHAGNEIKIVDDIITSSISTAKQPIAPTQIKESKIILPTKYITHTQTLTVTTTKTTVVKSLGAPPSTLTLLITKTRTSTIVDTVTQTQTLVQPTNIIETVTDTITHTTTSPVVQEVPSKYPSFPVQATAVLQPEIIPTILHENIQNDDDHDLDEFIIKDTEPPVSKETSSSENEHYAVNQPMENDSIFVVMTDKKPSVIKVPQDQASDKGKVEEYDHPHRDEILSNDVNRVLLGGILIASPPSLESPNIVPSGASNECKPDCKASRNELCQRVEGQMRCVCRPGFARMFPDRPCKRKLLSIIHIMC